MSKESKRSMICEQDMEIAACRRTPNADLIDMKAIEQENYDKNVLEITLKSKNNYKVNEIIECEIYTQAKVDGKGGELITTQQFAVLHIDEYEKGAQLAMVATKSDNEDHFNNNTITVGDQSDYDPKHIITLKFYKTGLIYEAPSAQTKLD